MSAWLDHHILHRKLLASRPPHDRLRHFDALLIWKGDRERGGFPRPHGQVTPRVATRYTRDSRRCLGLGMVRRYM